MIYSKHRLKYIDFRKNQRVSGYWACINQGAVISTDYRSIKENFCITSVLVRKWPGRSFLSFIQICSMAYRLLQYQETTWKRVLGSCNWQFQLKNMPFWNENWCICYLIIVLHLCFHKGVHPQKSLYPDKQFQVYLKWNWMRNSNWVHET